MGRASGVGLISMTSDDIMMLMFIHRAMAGACTSNPMKWGSSFFLPRINGGIGKCAVLISDMANINDWIGHSLALRITRH